MVHISLVRDSSRHNKKGLKPTRKNEEEKRKRRAREGEQEREGRRKPKNGKDWEQEETGCILQNVTLPGTSDH